jgi:hypothetical protein
MSEIVYNFIYEESVVYTLVAELIYALFCRLCARHTFLQFMHSFFFFNKAVKTLVCIIKFIIIILKIIIKIKYLYYNKINFIVY